MNTAESAPTIIIDRQVFLDAAVLMDTPNDPTGEFTYCCTSISAAYQRHHWPQPGDPAIHNCHRTIEALQFYFKKTVGMPFGDFTLSQSMSNAGWPPGERYDTESRILLLLMVYHMTPGRRSKRPPPVL